MSAPVPAALMAVCPAGLEEVAAAEIAAMLPGAAGAACERGKVYFTAPLNADALYTLRCVDNLYLVIARFAVGPHKADLDAFERQVAAADVRGALAAAGMAGARRVRVSASRAGRHTYSRFMLAQQAARALAAHGLEPVEQPPHDAALRADVREDGCVLSLQLTGAAFKYRGHGYNPTVGGLRPSVAHCLVRLGAPQARDVFIDPFCGAGTIAAERAHYPARKIFAADIDPAVAEKARQNLAGRALVLCADALATGMKTAGVDAVVTNMPWGRQVAPPDLEGLYRGFAAELARMLKPAGRALVLTDRHALLQGAAAGAGLCCRALHTLSLHGLHPAVYRLGGTDAEPG